MLVVLVLWVFVLDLNNRECVMNRRNLIGEVSLPQISEKVWNRINVELSDWVKMYNGSVSLDYAVSEKTTLIVKLSDNESFYIMSNIGTNHRFAEIGFGSSQGVTVTSWTPLEDDNYKYIVFPMYLEVGDNGDKGKLLYEYLIEKYSNLGNSIKINDDIWIDGVKIFAKDENLFWGISFDDDYIWFTSSAAISYILYADGNIEKIDDSNMYE